MRIIAGAAKGRTIQAPKGLDTRPTLDRVKEAMFGAVQFRIAGARVLDLFAGSGNLGLEALSRGAIFAVLNDRSRTCCKLIEQNGDKLGFGDRMRALCLDYSRAADTLTGNEFDLVFLDPPYKAGLYTGALAALRRNRLLVPGALVILEHSCGEATPLPDTFRIFRETRRYGEAAITILEGE